MKASSSDEYRRYEHIYEMERLYLERSYSDQEMADYLGTDRTNVWRIRKLMTERMGIPIEEAPEQRGRYRIAPEYNIQHIPFSREQMVWFYLAGRRLQQQTRSHQKGVADTLSKFSHALRKPLAEHLVRAAEVVLDQEQDEQFTQVFATLVECWLDGIPVRISHRRLRGQLRSYVVHPYQIEPAVWGDGHYLIGYSEYHEKLATFKIERIEKATKSIGSFVVPADFDVHELLEHAWGIWHADAEPSTVRLRFSKGVTPRVMETIWHPQQLVKSTEDDGCIWEAPVAEWREMVPWVRGWGSDVTVEAPLELRDILVHEASRLAEIYGVKAHTPSHMLFWAKTDKTGRTHPLICHLIDVGQVAMALWSDVLTESFRQQMADALELKADDAGRLLAFWVACHDIGKASPNFQRKYEPARPKLEAAGFTFPKLMGKSICYHATISALILPSILREETNLDQDLGGEVAQALGGHHGTWPTDSIRRQHRAQLGDDKWADAQRALVHELVELFAPPTVKRLGRDIGEQGTLLVLLSGLTSVADWIGSMSEFFHFSTSNIAPASYAQMAARRARSALRTLGWLDWRPPQHLLSFDDLHGFTPRPAQRDVIDLLPGDREPTLVIVEIGTGMGKTELALYLADRWAVLRRQRGFYVAMPTQATSNQMFGRVGAYLRKRYPAQQINYHLIHSGVRWRSEQADLAFETEDDVNDKQHGTIKAQGWFLPRKRTLLAPFAVGTVDQALMSTLQTRHFFVRLFGLSGKTVIFDEVHAYDTYMNTLFEQLLTWLRAVGASVIVLSATLPEATRHRLIKAWRGSDEGLERLDGNAYPTVTVASAQALYGRALSRSGNRTVGVKWIDHALDAIVDTLRNQLVDGGCVAVICNRVQRAQEVYEAVRLASLVPDDDLLLFHARTPGIWRDATEKAVLDRFGKDAAQRPQRSIVVATQVIEQSLDLDFDLMITDLAPIDLVLQRAGRLHRHDRPTRPTGLEEPVLLVTRPEVDEDGNPAFGWDGRVYAPYVLLRSFWTLQANGATLRLPEQTVALIEAVYGGEERLPDRLPENADLLLVHARAEMEADEGKARFEANKRLIASPDHEDLLWLGNEDLEEDDPQVHASLQAMTRLMRPTVDLVCLHGPADADVLALDPDGAADVDLKQEPTTDLTRALALRVVSVSNPVVLAHFAGQTTPAGWRNHPLLHTHRLAVFTDGVCELEGADFLLRLSAELGLEIVKLDA